MYKIFELDVIKSLNPFFYKYCKKYPKRKKWCFKI